MHLSHVVSRLLQSHEEIIKLIISTRFSKKNKTHRTHIMRGTVFNKHIYNNLWPHLYFIIIIVSH